MRLFVGDYCKKKNAIPATWTLVCRGEPRELWNISKSFLLQIRQGLDLYFVSDDGETVIGYYRDSLNSQEVKKVIDFLENAEYN